MTDMNFSWGSNFSKPKDNSLPSKFAIFQGAQGPRRGLTPIRQICSNSREGSNFVSSEEVSSFPLPNSVTQVSGNPLNPKNRLKRPLDLEILTENFFLLYTGEGVELHSSCTPQGSLEKLAEGHFSVSTKKQYEVFDKKYYKFLLKLILSRTQITETFSKEKKLVNSPTKSTNNTPDIESLFSQSTEAVNTSQQSGHSSISFERPWSFKSKNVLIFLFSIFLADSRLGASPGLEKNLSASSFHKSVSASSNKNFNKKHTRFTEKQFGIWSMLAFLRTGGWSSLSFRNQALSKPKFIQQANGKNQFFPFLILFYLVFLGFNGSQQKFLLHQHRISVASLETHGGGGKAPRGESPSANLRDSKNFVYPHSREKLRFSEYSPIKITGEGGAKGIDFSIHPTHGGVINPRSASGLSFKPNIFLTDGNIHLSVEKILRYSVHISTQLFVFFLIQRLISENNFGRHNPLRQKDAKTNQARILWPKKSRWFQAKTKSVVENTLPGIQDISTLVEVLIQSLNSSSRGFISLSKSEISTEKKSSFIAPPKGYLFVGPPGTGKTLLAQEIAQLAEVPFICVSASEIQKQIEIGTRIGALRLRKLFQQAQSLSPCILFFDEIDAIAQRQSQHDSKLFTEFLIQMDSWGKKPVATANIKQKFNTKSHSVILGTTNYLDRLDSAFVRSGRFDRILALNYPSKKVRFDILKFYLKKHNSLDDLAFQSFSTKQNGSPTQSKPQELVFKSSAKVFLGTNLGLNYLSFVTDGFSQAHLAKLVNESLLFTLSQNETLLRKSIWSRGATKKGLTKHSFASLLHGLKQMLIHRNNLPYQKMDALN